MTLYKDVWMDVDANKVGCMSLNHWCSNNPNCNPCRNYNPSTYPDLLPNPLPNPYHNPNLNPIQNPIQNPKSYPNWVNFGENRAVGMGRILAKTGEFWRFLANFDEQLFNGLRITLRGWGCRCVEMCGWK